MRVRARCNKRNCQARKTLRERIDPNDRPPCHMPGCNGLMYEDKHRAKNPATDRGYRGYCKCIPSNSALLAINRTGNMPHYKGQPGCVHHQDYVMESSLTKGTRTHSPTKRGELNDCDEEPTW